MIDFKRVPSQDFVSSFLSIGQLIVSILTCLFLCFQTTAWSQVDLGVDMQSGYQSGTAVVLQQQVERIHSGKKPGVHNALIPEEFFDRNAENQTANAYRWPSFYFRVSSDRTDSDGDGLRECRFHLDFSAFAEDGGYTEGEITDFEAALRRCVAMWNSALSHVGLEFLEVNDGSHHILFEAASFNGDSSILSQATLFGAWSEESPVFQINSNYTNFGAYFDLFNNDAPAAVHKRPQGNPYVYIFPEETFGDRIPISHVFHREIGHLVGLIEPWLAYVHSKDGELDEYLIDWLSAPTIGGLPPRIRSFSHGGENLLMAGWSRGYINSFMTDDAPRNVLYPELPPPIQAFIAHHYARYDYQGAQTLLNQAIDAHTNASWLAQGRAIQEIEPNDTRSVSANLQINLPILGALSSVSASSEDMRETATDLQDWYRFEIVNADLGRELTCSVSTGTTIGVEAQIEIRDSQNGLLATSENVEFPEVQFDPPTAGVYYAVVKSASSASRDYLLSLFFSDGEDAHQPTFTPTPAASITPTQTPVPIPALEDSNNGRIYGLGTLEAVAYSPDGDLIATGGSLGVFLWNVETGQLIRVLAGHSAKVSSLAFSPNGEELLTGSYDGTAKLWNVEDGLEIQTYTDHSDAILSVAFSADGTWILTGGKDKTAKQWDKESGTITRTFSDHSDWIYSVAISPDGTQILTGSRDNTTKLWNVETGSVIRTFGGHSSSVRAVAFSPDGETILTGSSDTTTILWNSTTGAQIRTYVSGSVESAVFSGDGTKILVGGSGNARLWDAASDTLLATFNENSARVRSVAFSPDGTKAVTGSVPNNVTLWNLETYEKIREFSGHTGAVYSVDYSPDGTQFITGSEDRIVRLWDVESGQVLRILQAHTRSVNDALFSEDGEFIVTASDDNTGVLWDVSASGALYVFEGHTDRVYSAAISIQTNRALTGGADGSARIWNIETGELVRILTGHDGPIHSVALSRDGTMALTGGEDGRAILWEASTGQILYTFNGHLGAVNAVTFSADGSRALTGSSDGTAILWNTQDGRELLSLEGHTGAVNAVAISPNGKWALTASGQTAVLWNIETGTFNQSFLGHLDTVNSVVFSPNGERFLCGGNDGTARSWDIAEIVKATPTPTLTPTLTHTPTATVTPTVTNTRTPTNTPIPTQTPVLFFIEDDTVVVTDDLHTTENLVGGYDRDHIVDSILAIRWKFAETEVTEYHIYASVNDSTPEYIARVASKDIQYYAWRNPEFGNHYLFSVFALREGAAPIRIEADAPVLYLSVDDSLPTPTATSTPTATFTPSPSPTGTPVVFEIPDNTIVVTDDLHSTEDLVGKYDQDNPLDAVLAVRWPDLGEDITSYHIYVSVDGDESIYIDRVKDPSQTYFLWDGPEFNHSYQFTVYALRSASEPIEIQAEAPVLFLDENSVTPTPTPTNTPIIFDVPDRTIVVTDDLYSVENLVGGVDDDTSSDRALAIRWGLSKPNVTDFHLYVNVNGANDIYLGRTGTGSRLYFDWREGAAGIDPAFRDGPQFNTVYQFIVFGIVPGSQPIRIGSEGDIKYIETGGPTPTATMTPEPTKDPSHFDIPNNTVYVTDDLQSTVNLVGSADEDTKLNKALAIRWNTNVTGILNFHLYVQVKWRGAAVFRSNPRS